MDARIDKWLWCVRLYKTRSLAAEACKKGHVMVNGIAVKPSHMAKIGEVVQLRRAPVVYSFKVLGVPPSRVGAKQVADYMVNVTTPDQLQLLEMLRADAANSRAKGTGRPTKRERRQIDDYLDQTPFYVDDEWNFEEE